MRNVFIWLYEKCISAPVKWLRMQFTGFVRICYDLPIFHPHLFFLSYFLGFVLQSNIVLWKCISWLWTHEWLTNVFVWSGKNRKICNHPTPSTLHLSSISASPQLKLLSNWSFSPTKASPSKASPTKGAQSPQPKLTSLLILLTNLCSYRWGAT